jgi:nucleoside-diphosphate-sugar epimerase
MTKLIIGCGYLGSRIARLWRKQGHHVIVTKRRREEPANDVGDSVFVCDVLDPATLEHLPAVDTVAYAIALDRTSGQTMRAVYVDGLRNVLRQLPKPKRFLFVSSSGVYGQLDGEWVDESAATEPREESGRIVLEAEGVLRTELPDAIILRFAGIYGPGRLLRQKAILAGEPIQAEAFRWLNLIHVEDGARAVLAAEEHGRPGSIINVSDGQPMLRCHFYTELARVLNAPLPRFADLDADAPSPPHEQSNRRIDHRRLVEELRFTFLFPSYREGLAFAPGGNS